MLIYIVFYFYLPSVITPTLLRLFHYFSLLRFHFQPQTNAMMTSSKMNCGTIHTSLHIAKWYHALSDTTNKMSPAVSKKRHSGSSQNKKKVVVDPAHLLVLFHHPLLLHPKKMTQLSIKVFYVSCLFVFSSFYLIVVFVLVSHEIPLFDFQWIMGVGHNQEPKQHPQQPC